MIGYTELDFVNHQAPAINGENLNHMDEGVKACADAIDAMGNVVSRDIGTTSADAAAGDAPAAAQAAAESTAALALAGHVEAADPHPLYALESALGNAAGKDVGTTPGTVAAGDDARLPTTAEKTRLSDIQAATGATTALKLANLASPATTLQQGVALLAVDGGTTVGTVVQANDTRIPVEGNWTPGCTIGGSSEGISYGIDNGGRYYKTGKNYHLRGVLALTSKGGLTGDVVLIGLPASTNGILNYRIVDTYVVTGTINAITGYITGRLRYSSNTVTLQISLNEVKTVLQGADIKDTFQIAISIDYATA